MPSDPQSTSEIASPAVVLTAPEMSALIGAQEREIIRLRRQVACFQRQIFGEKSERRTPEPESFQGTLGEAFDVVPDDVAQAKTTRIAAHERASSNKDKNLIDGNDGAALFFDELVHQLTPRIWKEMFAANPLRSDLHDLGSRRAYATL